MHDAEYRLAGKRVWVAGHRGLVGSAVVRRLAEEDCEILTAGRQQADLRSPSAVNEWMDHNRPHAIFLAAATVGGIHANNTQPGRFIYDNLAIATAVIEAARNHRVEKLLFLGSSCIYPRMAPQPIPETALLTGPLEPTNEWYAIAKIAGIKMCQAYRRQYGCDFISVMPTNLYGPGDNFDPDESHVVPGLMNKMHQAKVAGAPSFAVWGSGNALRDLLFVDDAADGIVFAMKHYSDGQFVNLGSGEEIRIADLAKAIARTVGYNGLLSFDVSMPDGTPRKIVDVSRMKALGWQARTALGDGLKRTYEWYLENLGSVNRKSSAAN